MAERGLGGRALGEALPLAFGSALRGGHVGGSTLFGCIV
jgi:hypothetical protein